MKFTTAYYLLLLYVTVMCKPLLPIVSDAWAHTFNAAAHMHSVHSTYGKNHVDIEIAKEESKDGTNKTSHNFTIEDLIAQHLSQDEYILDFRLEKNSESYATPKNRKLPSVMLSKQSPPPRI